MLQKTSKLPGDIIDTNSHIFNSMIDDSGNRKRR